MEIKEIANNYEKDIDIIANGNLLFILIFIPILMAEFFIFSSFVFNGDLILRSLLFGCLFLIFIFCEIFIVFHFYQKMINKRINAEEQHDNLVLKYNNYFATKKWNITKINNYVTLDLNNKIENTYLLNIGNNRMEISEEQYELLMDSLGINKSLLILTSDEYNKLISNEKLEFLKIGVM